MLSGPSRIFTSDKSFAIPWIGSEALNRSGLHIARILVSDLALQLRQLQTYQSKQPALCDLAHDGVVAIPNFLPDAQFAGLQEEVRGRCEALSEQLPAQSGSRGFGERRPFVGGFDRFDGGTLNRFSEIHSELLPACAGFVSDGTLKRYCETMTGYRHRPKKFWIHEVVHGSEETNPDDQKLFHRDTFHGAHKLWFFTEDVLPEDGPFCYVVGSHRMHQRRLRWEYEQSVKAARGKSGGAFRITEEAIEGLGLPKPTAFPLRANTLVLANVRGFHRRGDAAVGARRVAIHASLRPSAFVPVPY